VGWKWQLELAPYRWSCHVSSDAWSRDGAAENGAVANALRGSSEPNPSSPGVGSGENPGEFVHCGMVSGRRVEWFEKGAMP
jgi:hypothetical protein